MSANFETNQRIADRLREGADLLEAQRANPFRVAAYRRAALTLESLARDVGDILATEGVDGLLRLPGIGESLGAAIREILVTGRWSQLDRLRGTIDPTVVFRSVPGIGPQLATRIHDSLHIDTLEGLEAAAHDGRLATVSGLGPRRIASIRATLASQLSRVGSRARSPAGGAIAEPSVEDLLDVDREYRQAAADGRLPTIAPRRFNPSGEAWLPILHTARDPWHFTALYSNSARAHELGRTRDWVVVYFYDRDHREGQRTIVTETHGLLLGARVVRGRELECKEQASSEARTAAGPAANSTTKT